MKKNRTQVYHPVKKRWTKVDTKNGRVLGQKKDGKPWKNVKKVEVK